MFCVILCFVCTVVSLPPGTNPFAVYNSNKINKNEKNDMCEACSTNGDRRCAYKVFGVETRGKEST